MAFAMQDIALDDDCAKAEKAAATVKADARIPINFICILILYTVIKHFDK